MSSRKPTTKRSVATQSPKRPSAAKPRATPPAQSLPSKALLDRFKREQLEAIDNRSMLISKRDAIIAKAEAEIELVNADIADLDACIRIFDGALAAPAVTEAVEVPREPIPAFLSGSPWPLAS